MFEAQDVHIYYGDIYAIRGVSIRINEGEVVTCLGANGAGKTTLLNGIMGIVPIKKGKVSLEGQDITNWPTEKIAGLGISFVQDGRQVFTNLSVENNLVLGAYLQYCRKRGKEVQRDLEFVYSLFPILAKRRNQKAGTLSGGERQMLAIGCGIMAKPRLFLLDEPSTGLSILIIDVLSSTIITLQNQGAAILLVEQNSSIALKLARRGYVFQTGRIVLDDTIESLSNSDLVQSIYLGKTQ